LLGTTTSAAFPVSPNTWAEINANPENYPNALALEMDEPLYNAIYDKYATRNVLPQLDDPNDASSKGWITTVEAGNWGGTSISLTSQGLTGSIRGIMYFVKLQKLSLENNKLAGNIVGIGNLTNLTQLILHTNQFFGDIATIGLGNLTELTSINLGNNYIDGDISQAGLENLTKLFGFYCNSNRVSGNFDKVEWDKLVSLKTLEIVQNRLTGYVPTSLFTLPYLSVVGLYQNPHLTTPSVTEVPLTWATYLNFGTITDETPNLNRVSTQVHYAMP
jgi:Leucine-rich repeat (LRR) protein